MKNLNYKNVLQYLLQEVSEFKNFEGYISICKDGNGDNQYVVFGLLQIFLKKVFKEKKFNLVKKIADFLEKACSSDDIKLKELVMFGFMEVLYGNYEDFDKDMLDYFGHNTKKVLIDTVEHNSKIGMENKEEVCKLFGGKLNN